MKIKEIIKKTGRYEQIMEYLIRELTSNGIYCVRPFYGKNLEIIREISSTDVHKGIKSFMRLIGKQETEITKEYYDQLWALERRVSDHLDTLLHNYANEISHRVEASESDMETIRALQVLQTVIEFFSCDYTIDERCLEIPVGWYSDEYYNKEVKEETK